MTSNKKAKPTTAFWRRHPKLKLLIIAFLFVLVLLIAWRVLAQVQADRFQAQLQPFYNTDSFSAVGKVGEVVRQEPLGANIQNGSSQRILYRTQRYDGSYTFSSGMLFIPNGTPTSPRPIVAWAHGTIGMGDQCAPSRLNDPTGNIAWVNQMLQNGWIVVATDYAGLGTDGTEGYLVGQDEAHDVLNSVRAARQVVGATASNEFAIWGHSQGGHSALFSASMASGYAPELQLKGTVASAPAAELSALFNEQYNTSLGWVIGPEVLVSWPNVYKNLDINQIATAPALRNYQKIAYQCIDSAAIEGLIRNKLGQSFFSTTISNVPSWNTVATEQTAPILSPNQPLMIAQSETDQVVLANTTAQYIQRACQANSNLSTLWISGVGHIQTAQVVSPDVTNWISDRFANRPNTSTCNQTLPVAPVN